MADETNEAAQPQAPRQAPQLQIRAQLTRNLTFSNPGALQRLDVTPSVSVNINVEAAKSDDENYLVGLKIQCGAKSAEDKEIYTITLDYAGLFRVVNAEANTLEPLLLIECPRILFPFARRIIADVTRDGGYSPLLLDPVDFIALYRRELARRQENQAANGAQPANA